MIKVDVISGFLGAGKTTLIKKMYAHAFRNEQVVLIENEFGEVGIDGGFLRDAGIEIKEINSGCICCTLVGDFNRSLSEVIDRFHPDRIIIEPSGVGKLSDIVDSIVKFGDALTLNVIATVVDATKCKRSMRNYGEFYVDQIKQANTVVISKGDIAGADLVAATMAIIRSLNARANIVTTSVEEMDGGRLLAVLEKDASLMDDLMAEVTEAAKAHHHHHHYHHHEDGEECHCHDDEDENEHHHHHDDEDEDEHHHHHDDEDDEEECHCHHHDEDEDEHEHHHHHHHEEEEGEHHHDEEEHHHHHDDDEDEDGEECHCHHHDEDEDEHEHHHEGHHHHHGHDADEVFDSWGAETARSYTHDELQTILQALSTPQYGDVLRSKGIVKATDNAQWYYFDLVAGDYEIRLGAPDYTGRLCVIGGGLHRDELSDLFGL